MDLFRRSVVDEERMTSDVCPEAVVGEGGEGVKENDLKRQVGASLMFTNRESKVMTLWGILITTLLSLSLAGWLDQLFANRAIYAVTGHKV